MLGTTCPPACQLCRGQRPRHHNNHPGVAKVCEKMCQLQTELHAWRYFHLEVADLHSVNVDALQLCRKFASLLRPKRLTNLGFKRSQSPANIQHAEANQ